MVMGSGFGDDDIDDDDEDVEEDMEEEELEESDDSDEEHHDGMTSDDESIDILALTHSHAMNPVDDLWGPTRLGPASTQPPLPPSSSHCHNPTPSMPMLPAQPPSSPDDLPRARPQLVEAFLKSSVKMKQRYLTQRFIFEINRKRVDDQLKKRFGRKSPSTFISFIMMVETTYALRRLVRMEHCYTDELLQPLPNRLAQVVKMRLVSMRRAAMFLNLVSFQVSDDEFAFMMPSGVCSGDFSGTPADILRCTDKRYEQVPGPHLPHWSDEYVPVASFAGDVAVSALPVAVGDQLYIISDRHEHTYFGVEDNRLCLWYLVLVPDAQHRGLMFRMQEQNQLLPVKGRFGWVPSSCVSVKKPVRMQYSLNTLKFKLSSPRLKVKRDGTVVAP